ncbi:MAG TPA: DUF2797 domain-containing protein [Candidatus Acidoferrales bacterium]|nr:DUF2797 domain-containing protein [Candidatus Acidoferrales bacterium]
MIVKIIGFSSLKATLLAYPTMELLPLSGSLSLGIGRRTCIGKWHAGVYRSCDNEEVPVCSSCREVNPCAICTGTCLKGEKTCLQEHAVYLAMFRPDIFKIGVAKANRLDDRLREQGADVAAVVDYLVDGELARSRELELQKRYKIKSTVRHSEKTSVDTELDLATWGAMKAKMELQDERRLRYFDLPLWMRPLQVKNELFGRVIGVKGRLLVFEKDATLYGFDLNDVLGAEVFPIGSSERQVSLRTS